MWQSKPVFDEELHHDLVPQGRRACQDATEEDFFLIPAPTRIVFFRQTNPKSWRFALDDFPDFKAR